MNSPGRPRGIAAAVATDAVADVATGGAEETGDQDGRQEAQERRADEQVAKSESPPSSKRRRSSQSDR